MQITTVWVLLVYTICYLNMIMSPLTSALNTGLHTNFLTSTALRTSVPKSLKARVLVNEFDPVVLEDAHKGFDIKSAKNRQFYKLYYPKKLSYQIC